MTNEQYKSFERTNEMLKSTGMSKHNIAVKADVKPSVVQTISRIGAMRKYESLYKLCKTYGVSADWLLGLSDEGGVRE